MIINLVSAVCAFMKNKIDDIRVNEMVFRFNITLPKYTPAMRFKAFIEVSFCKIPKEMHLQNEEDKNQNFIFTEKIKQKRKFIVVEGN